MAGESEILTLEEIVNAICNDKVVQCRKKNGKCSKWLKTTLLYNDSIWDLAHDFELYEFRIRPEYNQIMSLERLMELMNQGVEIDAKFKDVWLKYNYNQELPVISLYNAWKNYQFRYKIN